MTKRQGVEKPSFVWAVLIAQLTNIPSLGHIATPIPASIIAPLPLLTGWISTGCAQPVERTNELERLTAKTPISPVHPVSRLPLE